jgi:alkanesulfonate monooxygenase SsuD/methylene tetrahydromethanopterin reductase-like flavin-dependent oxidoreductase (luciferase family)
MIKDVNRPQTDSREHHHGFGIAMATSADAWKLVQRAEALGFSHTWFYDTRMLSADCFVAMGAAAAYARPPRHLASAAIASAAESTVASRVGRWPSARG